MARGQSRLFSADRAPRRGMSHRPYRRANFAAACGSPAGTARPKSGKAAFAATAVLLNTRSPHLDRLVRVAGRQPLAVRAEGQTAAGPVVGAATVAELVMLLVGVGLP